MPTRVLVVDVICNFKNKKDIYMCTYIKHVFIITYKEHTET